MEKICGNCKWLDTDPFDGGPVCVNKDSPYCAELWCPIDDTCDEWEQKVRCADCIHMKEDGGHANCNGYLKCALTGKEVDWNDYCSKGATV